MPGRSSVVVVDTPPGLVLLLFLFPKSFLLGFSLRLRDVGGGGAMIGPAAGIARQNAQKFENRLLGPTI